MQYYIRILAGRPNAHDTEVVTAALKTKWPDMVDWDVSACAEQDEQGHDMYQALVEGTIPPESFGPNGTCKFHHGPIQLEVF